MLTVKEILTDKISRDIECIDRVYLNRYVKHLQVAGGLIMFIREQLGYPIPSPMLLSPIMSPTTETRPSAPALECSIKRSHEHISSRSTAKTSAGCVIRNSLSTMRNELK
ncbi:MAG: hypothetical protein P1P76_12350 [Anaerolineales bacterium]|nr:hypothetical protein [Anaerolineales bacterium]